MSETARLCYGKYEKNSVLALALEDQFPDNEGWSVVVRCYAALQLMNAYLLDKANVKLKLDAADHELRRKAMAQCPELRDAPRKYRDLKELSENIRYNPEFELTTIHRQESKVLFAKIIAIVDAKIKKS